MTENRYHVNKHFLKQDKVHDRICHRFMSVEETVEHMNMYNSKYKSLKEENEGLKNVIRQYEDINKELKEEIEKLAYANEDLLKEKREWKKLSDEYAKIYDENKKLKQQYSALEISLMNNQLAYNDLEKENEQLKQYIYDNLDEDICDVCSYQYLEKSQIDKYYVAKCKKGYDNCSKGTVINCKDFKFKELSE